MPIITDDFNRADVSPIAPNWSPVSGTGQMKIESNIAREGTTNLRNTARHTTSLGLDHVSRIVISAFRGGLGPAVRMSDDPNAQSYYFVNVTATGGGLNKSVAGTVTSLATISTSFIIGDTVELEVVGTLLRVYKNGAQIASATDSTLSYPYAGMYCHYIAGSGGGGSTDNFTAWTYGLPGTPSLGGPVYTGETVVNGLGVAGLFVEIYKDGALQMTVLVDFDGRWRYTFGAGLSTGSVLKARQKNAKGEVGAYCADVTVQTAVLSPPSILSGLYSGNTDVVGFAKPGVTVEVFKNAVSQGSTAADGAGVFRYVMGTAFTTTDVYTAKQTIAGTQSSASTSVKVVAAPANTDTYKTNIFDTLVTFDFIKNTPDTDDIRRSVASLLSQAALLGSSTHEIKNALGGLFYQYAARIAGRNG